MKVCAVIMCLLFYSSIITLSIAQDDRQKQQNAATASKADTASKQDEQERNVKLKWESLFDGKQLGKWKSTNFGGESDVEVVDNVLVLNAGEPLTGITWQEKDSIPTTNYEIELEAKRTLGIDFFCGLTFPVKKDHCTFVVAGWAGAIVGLSNIDGFDASSNATTQFMSFKDDQWYKIRVRVTDDDIFCWIDDKRVVKQYLEDKKISTRPEVLASRPLGICAYQSTAHLRNIRIRKLNEDELKSESGKDDK